MSREAVNITKERYVTDALEPFWDELGRRHAICRRKSWLQQDEAAPHTAKSSLEWLREHFPDRLITLKGEVQWVPHSPDLSP